MSNDPNPPRIESLSVRNYRALRELTLDQLTPLTVLLGPNGSGKSTVFDVFSFLSECFSDGLRKAWDRRGRFRELRSRNQEGPIATVVTGEQPEPGDIRVDKPLSGPYVLAVRVWLWGRTELIRCIIQ